jgi:hypothetical protein
MLCPRLNPRTKKPHDLDASAVLKHLGPAALPVAEPTLAPSVYGSEQETGQTIDMQINKLTY